MINKTTLLLVGCIALPPCLSFCQNKQTLPDDSTSFRFQKLSMQYQIREFGDVVDFERSILSAKYHFSNKSAIRISLDLGYGDSNFDDEYFHNVIDSLSHYRDGEYNNVNLNLSLFYLHYINPRAPVKFYLGGGPNIAYSRMRNDEIRVYPTSVDGSLSQDVDREMKTKSIGMQWVLGSEWFFHRRMSLLFEYGALFSYSLSKTDDNRGNDYPGGYVTAYESHRYSISSTRVKVGLSMYF